MAGDDDEAMTGDPELAPFEDEEASSGPRPKARGSEQGRAIADELRRAVAGLSGPDLEAAIDAAIERIVEHHVASAPPPLRDGLRRRLRAMLEEDPALRAVAALARDTLRRSG